MKSGFIGKYNSTSLFYFDNTNSIDIYNDSGELYDTINYTFLQSNDNNKNGYNVYAITSFLDKVYCLLTAKQEHISTIKAFVYDYINKTPYEIVLPSEIYSEIIIKISMIDYSFVVEQNKLFLIGGIMQDNKHIQKSIYTFDLSLYTFQKEKYQEFTLIPRYKHACTSQNGIIYIIGGFTSYPQSDSVISNEVQFGKYDNGVLHKFNVVKIEGEKPVLMIDPQMKIVKDRYVVSFSGYQYSKIWILDTKDNKGKNYDLRNEGFDGFNNKNDMHYLINYEFQGEDKMKIVIGIIKYKEKQILIKNLIIKL